MKKILLYLSSIPVLGLAGVLVWQNLPEKRFARHLIKARLYAKENNFTAARLEYEQAYGLKGGFTPYVSLEVLELMNRKSLVDGNPREALENSRAFVAAHPEIKHGQVILSQLAFQSGDLETAFDAVNAALKLDPAHFPARLLLTRVRTQQGRLDLAEEQLRFLYAKYPDSLPALLPLAENLLKQGRTEESRGFLRGILEDHPQNTAARLLLADSYLLDRKTDSAQAVLDAWQREADPKLGPALAVRRARLYSLQSRFPEAEEALRPYASATEDNAPAILERALLHAIQNRYDSALKVYAVLGQELPTKAGAAVRLSVYLHLKDLNPAKALEQVKVLQVGNSSPDLVPLALACYQALGQDNKIAEAIAAQPDSLQAGLRATAAQWLPEREYIGQWALTEYFRVQNQGYWNLKAQQEFHKRWPKNALAVGLLAGQLAALRQYAVAAQLLESLPEKDRPRGALFTLYVRAGQREKGKALAERILAESPAQRGYNVFLAEYAAGKGDKEKAMGHYRKELETNPADAVALNNLAWEYGVVRGDYAAAAPYLEKLKGLKARDARIWDTIGWLLARSGKHGEGEKYVRDALNLTPDQPSYMYHLGWILAQQGDKDAARKHIQSALESRLPFEERKEAEAFLAQAG